MRLLATNYSNINNGTKTIKDIIGKDISIKEEKIKNYSDYAEFKTSTFKPDKEITYYDNGQIDTISLKYSK